ncbi:hypothetical protein AB0C06_08410 [Micromonospora inaquosa]|uniref:hypothetical protein n=1 Tax=Micromonospora inaquosa TaxID=2203716 RepID=UPI0034104A64
MAALLGVAGCSSSTNAGQPQPDKVTASTQVAPSVPAMGSSGEESDRAEYELAVRRLETCLSASKVTLVNDGWDPIGNDEMILGYASADLTLDEKMSVARRCRATHLDAAAERFRKTHAPYVSPDLLDTIRKCLAARGVRLANEEKSPEGILRVVPTERRPDLIECVHEGGRKLYPDTPISFP